MMLKRILLGAGAALALTAGSYASFCGILIWSGNVHTVEEGRLYRSAQLTGAGFASEIDAHHIRTVLNLRGPNPSQRWYRDEIVASREHGAQHFDIGISAQAMVPDDKIAEILAVLRDAPKPILVHCKSGSDRTGFVSVLYRYAIEGQSAADAEHELSLWYAHFPYLTSKSAAMDRSARAYVSTHAPGGPDPARSD